MQKIVLMLLRRQHISIFISAVSIGFTLGIALSPATWAQSLADLGWIIAAVLLLVLCAWQRVAWMLVLALMVGMLFGIIRAMPELQDLSAYRPHIGRTVVVKGVVSDDVNVGKRGDTQIKLGQINLDGRDLSGVAWVSTREKVEIKRGFVVTIRGTLQKGFGSFAASMYRAKIIKITDPHSDQAREVRDWFADNVRKSIDEPKASLGIGYLVGQKSSLPENLEETLRIVGLTHIVVASGYNLTILVRFSRRLLSSVSKYLATLASGLMIGGFILVTGLSPSMTRAGLVTGISLAAWYYGRNIHPLILLPFVAALTLLINPSFLWGDLGWYLSFTAFAGVMILAPLLQNYFFGPKKPGAIRQIIGESLSAQLATMPIIAFSFGLVAVFALPANLLVLPLVPVAMALVFIVGLVEIFLPGLSTLASLPADIILGYMVAVAQWFANIPGASISVVIGAYGLLISYLLLIVIAVILQRVTRHNFNNDNIVD